MALTLKKAQRKRVKLKIGISAPSGGGKTASSLILAYGLIKGEHPDWNEEQIWDKVAIVDTENGSGELYAGATIGTTTIGSYNAISLAAPFTSDKYEEAIRACYEAGIEVCIIDSLSHVWNGQGGMLEQQSNVAKRTGNSYTAWREVTPKYDHLMQSILQTDMHIICTMRSKTEYVQEKDERGKTTVRKKGMAPQIRDNTEYEYSVYIEIDNDHQAFVSKDRTNTLDGQYFVITPETGRVLARWLDGAVEAPTPPPVMEKVPVQEQPAQHVDGDTEHLSDVIINIDASAKKLAANGAAKGDISATIKNVTGGNANYRKLTDIAVASAVLEALHEMEIDLGI